MTNNMVWALRLGQMGHLIKELTLKVKNKVKESFCGLTDLNLKAISTIITSKDMENMSGLTVENTMDNEKIIKWRV